MFPRSLIEAWPRCVFEAFLCMFLRVCSAEEQLSLCFCKRLLPSTLLPSRRSIAPQKPFPKDFSELSRRLLLFGFSVESTLLFSCLSRGGGRRFLVPLHIWWTPYSRIQTLLRRSSFSYSACTAVNRPSIPAHSPSSVGWSCFVSISLNVAVETCSGIIILSQLWKKRKKRWAWQSVYLKNPSCERSCGSSRWTVFFLGGTETSSRAQNAKHRVVLDPQTERFIQVLLESHSKWTVVEMLSIGRS